MITSNLLLLALGLNFAGTGFFVNELYYLGFLSFVISFSICIVLNKTYSFDTWLLFIVQIVISFVGNSNLISQAVYLTLSINNVLLYQTVQDLEYDEKIRFMSISIKIEAILFASLITITSILIYVFKMNTIHQFEIFKVCFVYLLPPMYSVISHKTKNNKHLSKGNQMV